MELLLQWVFVWMDNRLRTRLDAAVPNLAELWADPAAVLAANGGVRVGPRQHLLGGLLAGIPLGSVVGGGAAFALGCLLADMGVVGLGAITPIGVTGAALGGVAGLPLFLRLTRGGELHLLPSGLSLAHGRRQILLPWAALDLSRTVTWSDTDNRVRLPLVADELDRLVLLKNGRPRARAEEVRADHFWVDRPGLARRLLGSGATKSRPDTATLTDIYAVRPDELFPLVRHVAGQLR